MNCFYGQFSMKFFFIHYVISLYLIHLSLVDDIYFHFQFVAVFAIVLAVVSAFPQFPQYGGFQQIGQFGGIYNSPAQLQRDPRANTGKYNNKNVKILYRNDLYIKMCILCNNFLKKNNLDYFYSYLLKTNTVSE